MPDNIYTETLPSGFTFQMRFIPGGTFNMGSTDTDKDARENEKPHQKGGNESIF